MSVADLLADLRATRAATAVALSTVSPARLEESRLWRGAPAPLQLRLQLLIEGDDARRARMAATLDALGHARTVGQRAMVVAGETRGRLSGLLVGLPEALFFREPSPGEWSVGRTLGHIIATDSRYNLAIRHARERFRAGGTGPLRPPEDSLPSRAGEVEARGTMAEVLRRLIATRDAVSAELAGTHDAVLDAPTNWAAWDLDVRFRLHRFAAHDREHAIQVGNALYTLGWRQDELQQILGDAAAARGALEALLTAAPEGLLDSPPPGGGLSVAAIVAEAVAAERELAV